MHGFIKNRSLTLIHPLGDDFFIIKPKPTVAMFNYTLTTQGLKFATAASAFTKKELAARAKRWLYLKLVSGRSKEDRVEHVSAGLGRKPIAAPHMEGGLCEAKQGKSGIDTSAKDPNGLLLALALSCP